MNDHELDNFSIPSQLFAVRVWVESAQDGNRQVRVEVKHVLSGATRNFREWSQVVAFIKARLQDRQADSTVKDNMQCQARAGGTINRTVGLEPVPQFKLCQAERAEQ